MLMTCWWPSCREGRRWTDATFCVPSCGEWWGIQILWMWIMIPSSKKHNMLTFSFGRVLLLYT
jgi:hypothetical protein